MFHMLDVFRMNEFQDILRSRSRLVTFVESWIAKPCHCRIPNSSVEYVEFGGPIPLLAMATESRHTVDGSEIPNNHRLDV